MPRKFFTHGIISIVSIAFVNEALRHDDDQLEGRSGDSSSGITPAPAVY